MAYGVDLGTTNSSIAWSDDAGNVHSLKVSDGFIEPFDSVVRSIVLDPESEDFVVGQSAPTVAANRPKPLLVRSFKRRFDKQRLRQEIYRHTFATTREYDAVNQGVRYRETFEHVPLYYDDYSRAEVIAAGGKLFGHLLTRGELDSEAEGGGVSDGMTVSAVESDSSEPLYVGIPVLFGSTARRRLLAALVSSGCFGDKPGAYRRALKRCRLVYEPLALVSTLALDEPQDVVVVDYGGGTLDLAVLRVDFDDYAQPYWKELALGGRARAGDALDTLFRNALLEARPALAKAFRRQIAGNSDFDLEAAEAAFTIAKIRLSTQDEAELPLFNQSVTSAELCDAIRPEIGEAVSSVQAALRSAGVAASDVGTVLLTGGSSLIPYVQRRLHDEFSHLDELSFVAGNPGDVASAREALTGVSRGLARFGFLESFETTAACNYSLVVPGVPGKSLCLPRGARDERAISKAPPTQVPVADTSSTFALYSDLVREAYCGAVVKVSLPPGAETADVRVSASRDRFAPAFSVYAHGSHAALATFDLDAMNAADLAAFVEGDAEWHPSALDPSSFVLTKPLAPGDFVTWQTHGQRRRGMVLTLRHVSSGEDVAEMAGFDPHGYVIRVAREVAGIVQHGTITTGSWEIGDVRLD